MNYDTKNLLKNVKTSILLDEVDSTLSVIFPTCDEDSNTVINPLVKNTSAFNYKQVTYTNVPANTTALTVKFEVIWDVLEEYESKNAPVVAQKNAKSVQNMTTIKN